MSYATMLRDLLDDSSVGVAALVLPSAIAIPAVSAAVAGSRVAVGAQDVAVDDWGPQTGEITARDVAHCGGVAAMVGHAERRTRYGETDEMLHGKVAACARNGLMPVLCVGEAGQVGTEEAAHLVAEQVRAATTGIDLEQLTILYEPVWAIGASQPASVEHIRGVATGLRDRLAGEIPAATEVIYGGSAGSGILTDLWGPITGLGLGRFAHDPAVMAEVIAEAAHLSGE